MTREEALRVATICATADGGCGPCVTSLFRQLNEAFPEFAWEWTDSTWSADGKTYVKEIISVRDAEKAGA